MTDTPKRIVPPQDQPGESAVTTYADGFGAWHASLPDTGSDARNRELARAAILAELIDRGQIDPRQGGHLRVKRVRGRAVPGQSGRLTFAECWPTDVDYRA